MCGLTGFLGTGDGAEESVRRMTDRLSHRGPDDAGTWIDLAAGVALGHRRLSIFDLSPAGHQPMKSESGRYVITYNGEVYNFLDLSQQLKARSHVFRGHSDTEVILAAVEEWGFAEALTHFVGMFAIALWDREQRCLYLARDRMGEKPLYYGRFGGVLLFGSELKSLRVHPAFRAEVDRNALALFLRHNYVPAPYTIYTGVRKLMPGTWLSVSPGEEPPEPVPYWSVRAAAETGAAEPFMGTPEEAVERLDQLLRTSVRGQMVADVPLGVFLSGGIDSSTVTAVMQAESNIPVKTFTIGFHEKGYNEAKHAKAVANHLGTEHTELYITPREAMEVIPSLPTLYDEPFSDSSQIPTFLLSRMAHEQVTVALSGDGGDELFFGYSRYRNCMDVWDKVNALPRALRVNLGATIRSAPIPLINTLIGWMQPLLRRYGNSSMGEKLHVAGTLLEATSPETVYQRLVAHWFEPEQVVLNAKEPLTALTDPGRWAQVSGLAERLMHLDMETYLPDDILVKVDRASMGVSLETREPLLDHRLVEFAWRIPTALKQRNGSGKWLLKQVLSRYVPNTLFERPKMGFGVPIGQWLQGPMREWAEDLLAPDRLRREGYLTPELVGEKWQQHLSGSRNWEYLLWDVLMFQAWLESS